MSVNARVNLWVKVSILVKSNGTLYSSPFALTSLVTGWMMQAVPQPNISSRRPSFAACSRHTYLNSLCLEHLHHASLKLCVVNVHIVLQALNEVLRHMQQRIVVYHCNTPAGTAAIEFTHVCHKGKCIQESWQYLFDFLDAELALRHFKLSPASGELQHAVPGHPRQDCPI